MFAYINISGGNLIKSYKFDQQYLNMLLNNVQCTLCILICVLIICIFICSSKSEITLTITPLRGFFLNLSWFAFHAQDEKNQIITTNVWLNLVSYILDFEPRALNDNISFKQVGRVSGRVLSNILCGKLVCHQEWTDSNLKWNSSEYGNVEDIRMPPSALWKPDILMYNRCWLK